MQPNNNLPIQLSPRSQRNDEGFTLIELVIAMTVFMIVSGSVWGLLRVAQLSRSTVNQQVQLQKNVRLALNIIGRDTYNAGYGYPLKNTVVLPDNKISTLLGIPVDTDASRDTVPPIIAGNNVTTDTFNTVANSKTDQITLIFKDPTFNLVSGVSQPMALAIPTTASSIDELTPSSGSTTGCNVNDMFLVTGNAGATSTLVLATGLTGTKVHFATSDLLGFNQPTTGPLRLITTTATMQRVKMVTYFVASDGTLTRREYANVLPAVAYVDEPLVYGVDDFQIKYVMDDGSLTDNPSAGPDLTAGTADDVQANLSAVRQVRYTVSVRSIELNGMSQPYRETMTSTFGTRNLGYDAN